MKVKVISKTKTETYPYLAHHRDYPDLIVLFCAPNAGTVLQDTNPRPNPVGRYGAGWSEKHFIAFEPGTTIELTQE